MKRISAVLFLGIFLPGVLCVLNCVGKVSEVLAQSTSPRTKVSGYIEAIDPGRSSFTVSFFESEQDQGVTNGKKRRKRAAPPADEKPEASRKLEIKVTLETVYRRGMIIVPAAELQEGDTVEVDLYQEPDSPALYCARTVKIARRH